MKGEHDYISPRSQAEAERKRRVEIFDEFVDLALDGVITMEQAFIGYKEETEPHDAQPRTAA